MSTNGLFIGEDSFNKKFKNTLKDYYIYGFKNIETIIKNDETKKQTVNENIERLNNILGEEFLLEEKDGKIFISARANDLLVNNPFHRLYGYCNCTSNNSKKNIERFFNIFLQLSNISDNETTKTTSELCIKGKKAESNNKKNGKNNNFVEYLKKLSYMGLIEQIEGKNTYEWRTSQVMLSSIIEQIGEQDFQERFLRAIEFYSQYFIMGEIGQNILRHQKKSNIFRFKHEHIEQCLNDYNIVDLVECLEKEEYCIIEYKHGVSAKKEQMLCLPLRVRTNVLDGRQYLLYYEPSTESCLSLRVDFIEKISYINPKFDKEKIKKAKEIAEGNWGISSGAKQDDNLINDESMVKKVTIELLYDENKPEDEAMYNYLCNEKRAGSVKIKKYDSGEKSIIYTVYTRDTKEMRPWLRSFYGKIKRVEGFDDEKKNSFTVQSDVDDFISSQDSEEPIFYKETTTKWKERSISSKNFFYHEILFNEIYSIIYQAIDTIAISIYQIEKKENDETEIIKKGTDRKTKEIIYYIETNNIDSFIEKICSQYNMRENYNWVSEIIKSCILKLFVEKKCVELATQGTDFGKFPEKKEVYQLKKRRFEIPLNLLEVRWLLSILEDEKITLFLTSEEVTKISNFIKNNVTESIKKSARPFPIEKIDYVGQQLHELDDKEKKAIQRLLQALKQQKQVQVKYQDNKQVLSPLFIEYFREKDTFQGYFYAVEEEKIVNILLNKVESINILKEEITEEMRQSYNELLKDFFNEKNSVTIQFYDTRNIPDRILMEFAPWRKECICKYVEKAKRNLYTLKIYYLKDDEEELAQRLLGYGKYIRIVSGGDNNIREKIMGCYKKQQELFKIRSEQIEIFR